MTEKSPSSNEQSFLPDPVARARRRRRRMLIDRLAGHGMAVGGVCVIIAILLIFFYLLYEVAPLLKSAGMTPVARYAAPGGDAGADGATLAYILDEQVEVGARYTASGRVVFFNPENGTVHSEAVLPLPPGVMIVSHARGAPHTNVLAFGLSDGGVLVTRLRFSVAYSDNRRVITPQLDFPLGEAPLSLFDKDEPVRALAVQAAGDEGGAPGSSPGQALLAGWSSGPSVSLVKFQREESFLGEDTELKREQRRLSIQMDEPKFLLLDMEMRTLYLADGGGQLESHDVASLEQAGLRQQVALLNEGQKLTALSFLSGEISLIAGDSDGGLTQWFPVRDAHGAPMLNRIRAFTGLKGAVAGLISEEQRKGFLAVDELGTLGVFHATAHQTLLTQAIGASPSGRMGLAPRANALLVEDRAGQLHFQRLDNAHPEVSWSVLWGKVWYESYPGEDYVWQSSSASNDFEPKFSLVPLSSGTLKSALYALLVSMPLAILGAVYTAYFMAPALRQVIKPAVEIMGALPSVILGFLAGLWLAPALEKYLSGVFCMLLILPLGCVAFAWFWHKLPKRCQFWLPQGWQPLLMVPVVLALGWLSLALNYPVEQWLFGGDVRNWLVNEMHVGYDQRNAIVVGLAMGFAVIPTIFSIAEDAVFGVPKHLTLGSLALGATPWQTMIRVVLLTASPGIFSAVMIGMGRAVGETMIVLMATGNTPTTDFSPFQGMRTLAANIAVEMPESAVGSTHYRVLILAALVLFGFTFVFNTIAEVVRHRLRQRYSSL
jgi:phosphate transport system permease protein